MGSRLEFSYGYDRLTSIDLGWRDNFLAVLTILASAWTAVWPIGDPLKSVQYAVECQPRLRSWSRLANDWSAESFLPNSLGYAESGNIFSLILLPREPEVRIVVKQEPE